MHLSHEQKKESVWDYPRPPCVEQSSRHIRVVFNDATIAETNKAFRVLETSHPPVYYIPPGDVQQQFLSRSDHQSYCEFKGLATYYTLKVGERVARDAAWSYHNPSKEYD
jgi:uncharacterized protein (DUF427 family)